MARGWCGVRWSTTKVIKATRTISNFQKNIAEYCIRNISKWNSLKNTFYWLLLTFWPQLKPSSGFLSSFKEKISLFFEFCFNEFHFEIVCHSTCEYIQRLQTFVHRTDQATHSLWTDSMNQWPVECPISWVIAVLSCFSGEFLLWANRCKRQTTRFIWWHSWSNCMASEWRGLVTRTVLAGTKSLSNSDETSWLQYTAQHFIRLVVRRVDTGQLSRSRNVVFIRRRWNNLDRNSTDRSESM